MTLEFLNSRKIFSDQLQYCKPSTDHLVIEQKIKILCYQIGRDFKDIWDPKNILLKMFIENIPEVIVVTTTKDNKPAVRKSLAY